MKIGDTFLMDYPRGTGKHLIIVAEKYPGSEYVLLLLVHVTSINGYPGEDSTCILKKDDHEFIKHDSYVKYSKIFPAVEDYIDSQIQKGIFKSKAPLSEEILRKVQLSALNSPAIPNKYKTYFKKYSL